MITLIQDGTRRKMEFREFGELVLAGGVAEDDIVSGDVLTGGVTVRAGDLRTFAILCHRPLPPPRTIRRDPAEPDLTTTLARIRWEESLRGCRTRGRSR